MERNRTSNRHSENGVVALLADPDQHIGKVYQFFGPELLSYIEIGEMIGKILRNINLSASACAGDGRFHWPGKL
jgi:hypothetical protein